jgi:hypothetical protein
MWELKSEAILRILPELDGHSISHPSLFVKAGFPDEFVKAMTVVHKADLQRGISDLEALHVIAKVIGADKTAVSSVDRGEAAEQLKDAIRLRLSDLHRDARKSVQ